MSYDIDEGYTTYKISGEEFARMSATLSVMGQEIYQDFYAAKYKGFIVAFVVTYNSDASRDEVMSVLDQVQLDWD